MHIAPLNEGDVLSRTDTVTPSEVRLFGRLIRDDSPHHRPEARGATTLHGLFVVSLPLALIAEYGYIGQNLDAEAVTPAFVNEPLHSEIRIGPVTDRGGLGWGLSLDFTVTAANRRTVARGHSSGLLPPHSTGRRVPAIPVPRSLGPSVAGRNADGPDRSR